MIVLLTTVPGIEDVVIDEVMERFGDKVVHAEVFGKSSVTGKVLVNLSDATYGELRSLRTVEHAILIIGEGFVDKDLESLRRCIWKLNMNNLLNYYTPNTSLGIEADRSGDHDFKSPDAAALLGERITEFLSQLGPKPIFNLDNADLVLRLVIDHDRCILGASITRKPLKNRSYRVFNHPAAINPILANAMIRMLNPKPFTRICDITCGSGTIVIEGALYRRDLTFLCVDIDYGYVKGATLNAREAGVDSLIDFVVMDSRKPAIKNGACDHAAFNPPFGIRIEPIEGVTALYDTLFKTLRDLLRDGSSFIIITIRKSLVKRLANDYGFRIINERVVNQGSIWSSIFLLASSPS